MLDGYNKAEERQKMTTLSTQIKHKKAMYEQAEKIKEETKEDRERAQHNQFLYVIDKWRMLAAISKLKGGEGHDDVIVKCV